MTVDETTMRQARSLGPHDSDAEQKREQQLVFLEERSTNGLVQVKREMSVKVAQSINNLVGHFTLVNGL